jgi:hypothetical protein
MIRTIIVILICTAATASAQRFEIGLNGGIGLNTIPMSLPSYSFNSDRKTTPASAVSLFKLAYNCKRWKFGLEAEYTNLSYQYKAQEFYYINGQLVESFGPYKTVKLGNPAIPVKLFADYKISWKHKEVYGGVSAGYVSLSNMVSVPPAEWSQVLQPNTGYGFVVGVQLGGTYFMTQRIGINAELQGCYMSLLHESNKLFEFPATIGIRYRLGKITAKPKPANNSTKS